MKAYFEKYCLHSSEVNTDISKGTNCLDCGAFLTPSGVEGLKLLDSQFWSEVGVHCHYLACIDEESRQSDSYGSFPDSTIEVIPN